MLNLAFILWVSSFSLPSVRPDLIFWSSLYALIWKHRSIAPTCFLPSLHCLFILFPLLSTVYSLEWSLTACFCLVHCALGSYFNTPCSANSAHVLLTWFHSFRCYIYIFNLFWEESGWRNGDPLYYSAAPFTKDTGLSPGVLGGLHVGLTSPLLTLLHCSIMLAPHCNSSKPSNTRHLLWYFSQKRFGYSVFYCSLYILALVHFSSVKNTTMAFR